MGAGDRHQLPPRGRWVEPLPSRTERPAVSDRGAGDQLRYAAVEAVHAAAVDPRGGHRRHSIVARSHPLLCLLGGDARSPLLLDRGLGRGPAGLRRLQVPDLHGHRELRHADRDPGGCRHHLRANRPAELRLDGTRPAPGIGRVAAAVEPWHYRHPAAALPGLRPRLCHQDAAVSAAHLAAGRLHGRAAPGRDRAGRPGVEARRLRFPALQPLTLPGRGA